MKIFNSLTKIEVLFLSVILLIVLYEITADRVENIKDSPQEVTVWYFVYNNIEYKADYVDYNNEVFCVDGHAYRSPIYRFEKVQMPRSEVRRLRTTIKRCI